MKYRPLASLCYIWRNWRGPIRTSKYSVRSHALEHHVLCPLRDRHNGTEVPFLPRSLSSQIYERGAEYLADVDIKHLIVLSSPPSLNWHTGKRAISDHAWKRGPRSRSTWTRSHLEPEPTAGRRRRGRRRAQERKMEGRQKWLPFPALPANKKHNFKHVSDDG